MHLSVEGKQASRSSSESHLEAERESRLERMSGEVLLDERGSMGEENGPSHATFASQALINACPYTQLAARGSNSDYPRLWQILRKNTPWKSNKWAASEAGRGRSWSSSEVARRVVTTESRPGPSCCVEVRMSTGRVRFVWAEDVGRRS